MSKENTQELAKTAYFDEIQKKETIKAKKPLPKGTFRIRMCLMQEQKI